MVIQPNADNAIDDIINYRGIPPQAGAPIGRLWGANAGIRANGYFATFSHYVTAEKYAGIALVFDSAKYNLYYGGKPSVKYGANVDVALTDKFDSLIYVANSPLLSNTERDSVRLITAAQFPSIYDPYTVLSGLSLEKYAIRNNPAVTLQSKLLTVQDFKNNRNLFLQNRDYTLNAADREFLVMFAYPILTTLIIKLNRLGSISVRDAELAVMTQNEYNYILVYQAGTTSGFDSFNALADNLAQAGAFIENNIMSQELAKTIEVVSIVSGAIALTATGAAIIAPAGATSLSGIFAGAGETIATTFSGVSAAAQVVEETRKEVGTVVDNTESLRREIETVDTMLNPTPKNNVAVGTHDESLYTKSENSFLIIASIFSIVVFLIL